MGIRTHVRGRMASRVAAAVLACASGIAAAEVKVDDKVQTYSITGGTARALWDQMHELGPVDETEHRRFAAVTHWDLRWHYWYQNSGLECRIDRFEVSVSTRTTLPEWSDAAQGTPALRSEWAVFIDHLRTHEAGHRTHGLQAAETVERTIASIGHNRDCGALGRAIDAAGHAALEAAHRADIDYDASTKHGVTQGAVLP